MLSLTAQEREKFTEIEDGSYYGQIGITIRFGNHFWHECSGSLLAGACGGDNLPTLLKVRKRKHKNMYENSSPQKTKCFAETGKGYWMELGISSTLRAEGENRPSRPSNVIVR